MRKLRVVALLARPPGLAVLEDCLLTHPGVELVAVATHSLKPRSEDPARSVRPEMAHFERLCGAARIPLIVADDRATASDLPFLSGLGPVDLLCSLSWRFILSATALRAPTLGAINLHRGGLPAYGGAEPVRRMLEDGCPDAVITAHLMVEEVDAGPTIATVHLPMNWDRRTSAAAHAELVKERLIPLYPKLMALAIETMIIRAARSS